MSAAMLNIRVVQPRMMSLRDAATYVGITAKKFPAVCSVAPIAMPGNVELYDVQDLDRWVDQLKVGGTSTHDEILSLLDK